MKSSVKASWAVFYLLQIVLVGIVIVLFYFMTKEMKSCVLSVEKINNKLISTQEYEYEAD